jgi:hypothetical protein
VNALVLAVLACGIGGDKPFGPGDSDDTSPAPLECSTDEAGAVYERFIEPVMTDAHPNSCNQCHLSGVDLAMYVQDTPCQTMACMVELGAVDLESPAESRVLAFISNGEPDSALITEETLQREYDGFLEWIEYSAVCQEEACGTIADPCSSGTEDNLLDAGIVSPLGTCSEHDLVATFSDTIYHWINRCASCHYEGGEGRSEGYDEAPVWVDSDHGFEAKARTMYNVIGAGYMNVENPSQSLLILKPLDETLGGVYHDGGPKIHSLEEATYLAYVHWAETYAACQESR